MADDNETKSSPDAGRPRRPPPTIELTAAEVTERPAPTESAAPEAPSEPIDTAPSDMPPFEPVEAAAAEESKPASPPHAPVLVPAMVGAVAGALVAGMAWFGLNVVGNDTSDVDALASRVAQIEKRPIAAADTGLATRIDTLEKSIAALRGDLAAAKTQSDRVVADLNQLKSAPRTAAGVVDLGPINERLGQIERAASGLKSSAAQQNAKPFDDVALRRVVAASLLDTSVRQSEPYATALAAVKPLASNANQLRPLDAFATTGVPNTTALSRELLTVLPKLTPPPTEVAAAGTGFMDRLQAGAAKLIRIERTDAVGAGNVSGAVSRASAAAHSNDIVAARRELLTLAPTDRAAVQPWLDKVEMRDAALAASRQFAADAMAALSKPAP